MLAIVVVLVVGMLAGSYALDRRARAHGSRTRRGDDISGDIRERHRDLRARQTIDFRETGDDANGPPGGRRRG